jgi:hypothetical protein
MLSRLIILTFLSIAIISCNENKEVQVNPEAIRMKGDSIVSRSFDTLRNTLLRSIGEKGLAGAVEFCTTKALELTNTYSAGNISVKRTSDKIRNPGNAPDSMEQRILTSFRFLKSNKQEIKAILEKDAAGNYHYFKPIILQAMCLNCHGERDKQIQPETWQSIQLKYPADSAFNSREGDLRGTWHIILRDDDKMNKK